MSTTDKGQRGICPLCSCDEGFMFRRSCDDPLLCDKGEKNINWHCFYKKWYQDKHKYKPFIGIGISEISNESDKEPDDGL